jgi:hypothetical protein
MLDIVLLKNNHREHRENIIFHEVDRNFITPLCVLSPVIPLYPHLSLVHCQANKRPP